MTEPTKAGRERILENLIEQALLALRSNYDTAVVLLALASDAYQAGRESMREQCAVQMEAFHDRWMTRLPIDQVQALNCKQYAKAIRALPLVPGKE